MNHGNTHLAGPTGIKGAASRGPLKVGVTNTAYGQVRRAGRLQIWRQSVMQDGGTSFLPLLGLLSLNELSVYLFYMSNN
jgi:hypothetical protein